MKLKLSITLCVFFSVLTACEKEELFPASVEDLVFSCPPTPDIVESFFEGSMGGEQFCYFDGVDDYELNVSATTAFITDDPITSTDIDIEEVSDPRVWGNLGFRPKSISNGNPNGTPLPHLKHHIAVQTPYNREGVTSTKELIEKYITTTGELPLQSNMVSDSIGFNISFKHNDLDEGISVFLESAHGSQEDSYFRIIGLEITEFEGLVFYDVSFEFTCNLYNYRQPNAFFKRLEDATMRLKFQI